VVSRDALLDRLNQALWDSGLLDLAQSVALS
jgi:hypothetical protein